MTVEEAQDIPSYQETCQQQSRGAEKQGGEIRANEGGNAGADKHTHAQGRKAQHKQDWSEGGKKQANWLTRRFTLSYFTARTDGSHTPQRLLEGCVDVEAAVAIGEMLHIPQEKHTSVIQHS